MPDRAQYLARTLIARLLNPDDEHSEATAADERQRRMAVVEKILAVELGITDGRTISLVEAAVPFLRSKHGFTERDVSTLADFLRQHLSQPLAES